MIPDDNNTDKSISTNNSTLSTAALSSKRKQKSPADVLEMHIKKREEKKGG